MGGITVSHHRQLSQQAITASCHHRQQAFTNNQLSQKALHIRDSWYSLKAMQNQLCRISIEERYVESLGTACLGKACNISNFSNSSISINSRQLKHHRVMRQASKSQKAAASQVKGGAQRRTTRRSDVPVSVTASLEIFTRHCLDSASVVFHSTRCLLVFSEKHCAAARYSSQNSP